MSHEIISSRVGKDICNGQQYSISMRDNLENICYCDAETEEQLINTLNKTMEPYYKKWRTELETRNTTK